MEGFSMSKVRTTAIDLFTPDEHAHRLAKVTELPVPHLNALGSIPPGLLYPHQGDGVAFLISKERAILGDDMGLGKTRQAIVGMQVAAPTGMILVVCPASLKLNWRREIKMVDPDAKIEVLGIAHDEQLDPRWVIVNYDVVAKNAERLHGIPWSGVILDEAHFIKNNSQRTSHCLKLLGVSNDARVALIGPPQVYLLTGTPITNRPRDLFNLLRCVGHPSARSFLSFAKRYCDAYKNDYGWVTTGASNLEELNLLVKEVMLRRKKDEVLELPEKIRSWVPISVESAAARNAQRSFAEWFAGADSSRPNDKDFLARLTKLRVALHKAKHRAVEERIRDVISTDRKVIVFTAFTEGLKRHKAIFGEGCVTISGSDNAEQRMEAVDRFQKDPEVRVAACNIIAGGVGITLTAASHVIFQDLDWVPANHLQAEDRAYRLGQTGRVTVEYMLADGTLDVFIASLLEAKLRLINMIESEEVPNASVLDELYAKLRSLGPALLQENKALQATGEIRDRLEALTKSRGIPQAADAPLLSTGVHEFKSSRDPSKVYRVTFGSTGHLDCTCEGFRWRGNCKHVREVRESL
jgi:SWI/SNF-related matrix-associated actin-dependent regulator of chromatin subfamily A-like protein 1